VVHTKKRSPEETLQLKFHWKNKYCFSLQLNSLKKLSDLEVRKEYRIEISKWFAALEKLNDSKDMNRTWENIKEKIQI
jgi:hypothetical protein